MTITARSMGHSYLARRNCLKYAKLAVFTGYLLKFLLNLDLLKEPNKNNSKYIPYNFLFSRGYPSGKMPKNIIHSEDLVDLININPRYSHLNPSVFPIIFSKTRVTVSFPVPAQKVGLHVLPAAGSSDPSRVREL